MIDVGVHVRVKTIFLRGRFDPGGDGHFFDKANLHQTLAALETVLPWHDQAHGRTVLLGQNFAVHAKGQQGQWVHGLVQAQAFDIGPVQTAGAHTGHGFGIGLGHEFDEFGVAGGLDFADQFHQRIAHPRDHHGPAFHAAHAVNPLFHGTEFEQVFQGVFARPLDQTLDLDRPGAGLQGVRMPRRIGFVVAKFVKVVVAAGVFVGRDFVDRHRARHRRRRRSQSRQHPRLGGLGQGLPIGPTCSGQAGRSQGQAPDDVAALQVHALRRDLMAQRMDKALAGRIRRRR